MGEENMSKNKRSTRKKKWSAKKKVFTSIVVVLILILGTVCGGYFYIKAKIYTKSDGGSQSQEDIKYNEVAGVTNVLLIGIDGRTLDEKARSDSMMIATIDNNTKKVKLTSIYRDTMVNIPEYGEYKINAAYEMGGPELLMKTIKEQFDVKIDKYVTINFWGFEAVIDQMGGLDIDVKEEQLNELNKYIGESTGGNDCPVNSAGLQTLNGKQALSYARIRHGVGDDFARTTRQQEVISKILDKLKDTNPTKYLGIMNKMLDNIKTNINPMEALNMAFTIYKMPSAKAETIQVPVTALTEGREYKNLGWVFLMDQKQNAQIAKDFIYNDKMPDSSHYDMGSLRAALQQYKDNERGYTKPSRLNNVGVRKDEKDQLVHSETENYNDNR